MEQPTAFFAATIGVRQNDIKRIIAYSTCRQLGYMALAIGISKYSIRLLLTSTWIIIPRTAYYFYTIIFRYFKKIKTKLNRIREKKVKYQYIIATLTYPTLRILIHPQLILIPRWTARTTILNVPINNKNTTHRLFLNIYKSKKN